MCVGCGQGSWISCVDPADSDAGYAICQPQNVWLIPQSALLLEESLDILVCFCCCKEINLEQKGWEGGKKGFIWLTIPGYRSFFRGSRGRNLKQLVTSHPQSRADRGLMRACPLACLCSAQFLCLHAVQPSQWCCSLQTEASRNS